MGYLNRDRLLAPLPESFRSRPLTTGTSIVPPGTKPHWSVPPWSVFFGLGFFLLGSLSDLWLQRHTANLSVALADDVLVGIGAGFLVFLYMREQELTANTNLRYASIVESSDDAIFSTTLEGGIVSWNRGAQSIYGYTEAEALGKSITILLPPELLDEESEILKRLRAGERIEHYETVRATKTGKRVNISLTVSPIKDSSDKSVGFSGIARDITERKQAEVALSSMTKRWVEAQEEERTRIARELHDDISQRLAMLAIGLDRLRNERIDLPPDVQGSVQELRKETFQIATDIQSLSHELHSANLDYLGVVRAMTSWCKEFGERQQLEIDFTSLDVPNLPQEISRCLFRILQEAVHNAAKHSGIKRIEVQLAETSGEIHLTVRDSGKGFDTEAAKQSRGLGLTSMEERARLIGGTMAIESKPMSGTTIHVRVPLKSTYRSRQIAV